MKKESPSADHPKPPRTKPNWPWKIFLLIYLLAAVTDVALFFRADNPAQTYYKILIGFQILAVVPFFLNALAVIFDVIAILPFWGFVEREKIFTSHIWQWFFAVRLALLLTGHAYDYKEIQSLFHQDLKVALSVINITLIIHTPSYLANFFYAFVKFPSSVIASEAKQSRF